MPIFPLAVNVVTRPLETTVPKQPWTERSRGDAEHQMLRFVSRCIQDHLESTGIGHRVLLDVREGWTTRLAGVVPSIKQTEINAHLARHSFQELIIRHLERGALSLATQVLAVEAGLGGSGYVWGDLMVSSQHRVDRLVIELPMSCRVMWRFYDLPLEATRR